jgi:hypothetical protein
MSFSQKEKIEKMIHYIILFMIGLTDCEKIILRLEFPWNVCCIPNSFLDLKIKIFEKHNNQFWTYYYMDKVLNHPYING